MSDDRRTDPGSDGLLDALRRQADAGLDPSRQSTIEAALDARDLAAPRSRSRTLTAWIASHTAVVVVAGALAVGGTATAAVATLTGRPSSPTKGEIPRGPKEHRVRDLTYSVTVSPQLKVGEVGWCSGARIRYEGGRWFGGSGCGPAFVGDIEASGGGTTFLGKGRGIFLYSIVDRRVAYALLSTGERVVPTEDPALPNGWRAIVLLPGEIHDDHLRLRDAENRPVSTRFNPRDIAARQPIGVSDTITPAESPCSITLPEDASPRVSRWLTQPPRTVERLDSKAYLPCAQTGLRAANSWAEVVVLLDAKGPGAAEPAALPATTLSPDRADIVEFPTSGSYYNEDIVVPTVPGRRPRTKHLVQVPAGDTASARRHGKAWIVVTAPTRALRERLLDQTVVRAPGD